MNARCMRKSLCVSCLVLPVVLATAAMARAADATPSVLSRVQTVDDPDLADLLRVALETPRGTVDQVVHDVTESYAQIRLLDRQVEEIDQKIKNVVGSSELRHELVLAKADLESKRLVELARLRQVMGIIPRYALGRKNVSSLRTWLRLDVLDEQVYVAEMQPPFSDDQRKMIVKPVGLMSFERVLGHLAERLGAKDRLPIRIDIDRTVATLRRAEELEKRAVDLVKTTGTEMDAEVHLSGAIQGGPESIYISIKGDRIQLFSGSPALRRITAIAPTDAGGAIGDLLTRPENLPARFTLEYAAPFWQSAEQITMAIEQEAQRLGVAKYVEVVQDVEKRDPESVWLGRWQRTQNGNITEVAILPGHTGRLVLKEQTHTLRWTLGSDGIVLRDGEQTYTGVINADGNLDLSIDGTWVTMKKQE